MKSVRNKTIDFPIECADEYLKKVVVEKDVKSIGPNCTVLGDTFKALTKIDDKSIDLLIVDPPYNLDKNFHGNDFKKRGLEEYAFYTEKWIEAIKPKLKGTASLYVCCDWQSALVIGQIIDKHFINTINSTSIKIFTIISE